MIRTVAPKKLIKSVCQPWPLEQIWGGTASVPTAQSRIPYLTWYFLVTRFAVSRSASISHALPVNPRRDLALTHWSSLQPKVGQKASEDRARERRGEGGIITWGRIWVCRSCTFQSRSFLVASDQIMQYIQKSFCYKYSTDGYYFT